jgi:hypothetical protein
MKFLATVILIITLSGCIAIPYPHRITDMPEVQGTIVNAESNEPMKNITVLLSKYHKKRFYDIDEKKSIEEPPVDQQIVVTSDDGQFKFQKEEHWFFFKFFWLGPIDFMYESSELRLSYKLEFNDKPQNFDKAESVGFGGKYIYSPSFGHLGDAQYGPFKFDTLEINNPNQKLEPTLKTPVESVNVNSSAAHF